MRQKIVEKKLSRPALKGPSYSGVLLCAPDGTPLASVHEKRAHWYLSRKLAREVTPHGGYHRTVYLTFAPKGSTSRIFSVAPKENRCVVCGGTDTLSSHHTVPRCVRKQFPVAVKGRNASWCLLLCQECHDRAEAQLESVYRKELSDWQRQPLTDPHEAYRNVWSVLQNGHWHKIPVDRQQLLMQQAKLSQLPKEAPPPKPKPAYRVSEWAQYFIEKQGGVVATQAFFRQLFLDQMHPRYLPAGAMSDTV